MTLRVLYLSDLHLEMHPYTPSATGFDVVVLAGDIHTRERGVQWAQDKFSVPVVYVLGNHEGYGTHWEKNLEKMKAMAQGSHVHVLEKESVVIAGTRFLGATGWSDFTLWPNSQEAMYEAGKGKDPYSSGARDYRHIRTGGYRRLLPSDTAAWARQTKRWIAQELDQPFNGPTIVVTHHAPSAQSLPYGVREPLDATDGNPWDELVAHSNIFAWLHGHTHHRVKYQIGDTWVGSNPRGYPGQELDHDPGEILLVPSYSPTYGPKF